MIRNQTGMVRSASYATPSLNVRRSFRTIDVLARVSAELESDRLLRAMYDIGYFPKSTPPTKVPENICSERRFAAVNYRIARGSFGLDVGCLDQSRRAVVFWQHVDGKEAAGDAMREH